MNPPFNEAVMKRLNEVWLELGEDPSLTSSTDVRLRAKNGVRCTVRVFSDGHVEFNGKTIWELSDY